MASKRIGLATGGLLAGALLLGTAGLVAAQDPTATPGGGMMGGQNGAGMMGGQNGAGMMGGQMGAGMMGGQMGAGMMGGQMGAGMMGGQMSSMTAEQLEQMDALHDQMIESGVCDPAQMQAFHAQLNADR
ncbi:MAG: hypothetical protein AB1736_03515 [Chloroflexota bacterium]